MGLRHVKHESVVLELLPAFAAYLAQPALF